MDLIVKHFNELSTTELYEILKTRFEIFVTEQECI
jgi:ElaA protein